jgi:hypothetical protein
MRILKALRVLAVPAVIVAIGAAAFVSRDRWLPLLKNEEATAASVAPAVSAETDESVSKIILTDQAIANLSPARGQSGRRHTGSQLRYLAWSSINQDAVIWALSRLSPVS